MRSAAIRIPERVLTIRTSRGDEALISSLPSASQEPISAYAAPDFLPSQSVMEAPVLWRFATAFRWRPLPTSG
jgi:hypothetical protein